MKDEDTTATADARQFLSELKGAGDKLSKFYESASADGGSSAAK